MVAKMLMIHCYNNAVVINFMQSISIIKLCSFHNYTKELCMHAYVHTNINLIFMIMILIFLQPIAICMYMDTYLPSQLRT